MGDCEVIRRDYENPIWSPLRSATSTRLLVLHPAQTDDDNRLDASLREISLDDANVEYEAVSYTWSDQRRQQIIFIDGEEILIRRTSGLS